MKIKTKHNKIILFLNKYSLGDICLKQSSSIEEYFKQLIMRLRKDYAIRLKGEYKVHVYVNKYYGMIMELVKIDDDYFNDDIIDMKIAIDSNAYFLYKVSDYDYIAAINGEMNVYYYQNYFYCDVADIKESDFLRLLEYSEIIYGQVASVVIKKGQKIR